MRTIICAAIMAVNFAGPVGACGKGCEEMGGVCACDSPAEKAPDVQASTDTPRRGQQPAWETGEVKADMPQSRISEDAQADQQKAMADFEGKKAAGIK